MQKKPLVPHIYTADPSAHVFENRLYVYPSHDLDIPAEENDNGDQYQMTDYRVLSLDEPGGDVTDHGEALHVRDVPWASRQMWAPDAAFANGKYYLYFPARDKEGIFRIGAAVSDRPEGPFKAEKEPIKGSFSIDPCVLDDNGTHYMAFGGVWGGQLQCWTTGEFDPKAVTPTDDRPALCAKIARLTSDRLGFAEAPRDIVILDEKGEPLKASDNNRRYFEGPWIHKYNGKYYFSYSTGDTHKLVYGTSDSVYGPYTWQGVILTPPIGWTTHHSIVEYKGKWYLFYHDSSHSRGKSHQRCVKMQELTYRPDGSIVTMDP
jgi:beta-xylosidase